MVFVHMFLNFNTFYFGTMYANIYNYCIVYNLSVEFNFFPLFTVRSENNSRITVCQKQELKPHQFNGPLYSSDGKTNTDIP